MVRESLLIWAKLSGRSPFWGWNLGHGFDWIGPAHQTCIIMTYRLMIEKCMGGFEKHLETRFWWRGNALMRIVYHVFNQTITLTMEPTFTGIKFSDILGGPLSWAVRIFNKWVPLLSSASLTLDFSRSNLKSLRIRITALEADLSGVRGLMHSSHFLSDFSLLFFPCILWMYGHHRVLGLVLFGQ